MQKIVIIIISSYLLGSISASYILGKILANKDIRNHGSGNPGATNTLRVFGPKIAIICLVFDILKGVGAVIIGGQFLGYHGMLIGGICSVIGHNYPVFLRFKGGKGVATTLAVNLVIQPLVATICIVIGLIIIIKSRYVSLGAVIGMILLPIFGVILIRPFDINFLAFTLFLSTMSIYRHRGNIRRLLKGKESKLGEKV